MVGRRLRETEARVMIERVTGSNDTRKRKARDREKMEKEAVRIGRGWL
jgi:hypothetical protein